MSFFIVSENLREAKCGHLANQHLIWVKAKTETIFYEQFTFELLTAATPTFS